MFNTPETNFISSLRKNFINFVNDRIQTKIWLYCDMPQFATDDRTHLRIKPACKTLKRTIIRFRYNHVRFKIYQNLKGFLCAQFFLSISSSSQPLSASSSRSAHSSHPWYFSRSRLSEMACYRTFKAAS